MTDAQSIAAEAFRLAVTGHPRVDLIHRVLEVFGQPEILAGAQARHEARVGLYASTVPGLSPYEAAEQVDAAAHVLANARVVAVESWYDLLASHSQSPLQAYSIAQGQQWLHHYAAAAMTTPHEALAWLVQNQPGL